ncbi:MAG: biopolymer transporter ExbD [Deltaproteobacteria bacterium]|nr:biopolymer transporter ExbD [Deltaproteobacteria bacterium]
MGGPAAAARGGKRSLDVDVNLVPYIDMLMTIMGFLMMTAVWSRFAALEVQVPTAATATTTTTTQVWPVLLFLSAEGVRIQEEGGPALAIPAVQRVHDWEGVRAELRRLKAARPERETLQIHVDDGVSYDNVTRVIDIATALKLPAVSLEGA